MKRLTAVLLAVLVVPALAFCAGRTENESGGSSGSMASNHAPGPFGKYEPSITVSAVRSTGATGVELPEGETLEDNVWSHAYEDDLGITIDYLWTTTDSQYVQKMNIAITSDDLPDIMHVNAAQLKMLVDNGQAAEIGAVLDEYSSPFTREVMHADGGRALQSATFDGGLYAIPQMNTGLGNAQVLWVRTDWLDNLGLAIPKTMDDLISVADAFVNDDPDGNGRADTFGLGINKDLFSYYAALEGFFNGFGAYPNIWVQDGSGGIAYGSIQPEMRTALATLRDMYARGLIDREFGVKDATKVNEDVAGGKIGLFFGQFWNGAWFQDAKIQNPTMEWVPVAIPSATGSPAKVSVPFGVSLYYVVRQGAEYPEAAVKMLNLELDKIYGENAEPSTYGIDANGNGLYQATLLYCEPYKKNFVAARKVVAAIETGDTSKLNAEERDYYDKCLLEFAGDHHHWHNTKMFGPGGSLTVIDNYDLNGLTMDDEYFGAPTPAMGEKLSTLQKQQLIAFTDIILGASLDEFDKFVADWGNLGGTQMTAEVNEWYETQR